MDRSDSGATETAAPAFWFDAISWASPAMRLLESDIACASRCDLHVMISGENGAGKKTMAQRLHRQSRRAPAPLVITRLTDEATSSEILAPWLLDSARGGTIMLEHPQLMSPSVQTRLLEYLERSSAKKTQLGTELKHDVRLLTVTSDDLFGFVETDRFSDALFYRLNTIHLIVPPLRDRREDVRPLLDYFLSAYSRTARPRFSADAWERLTTYAWPGNVEELRAAIEQLVSRELSRPIELCDLPSEMNQD